MSAIAIIGAQWGDEGKGKLVDVMSKSMQMVVRFQGGANAGHTLVVQQKKTVLHLIPSGILYPQLLCLIGPGVVIDVLEIVKEIEGLKSNGVDVSPQRLMISDQATIILDYHKVLDQAREQSLGEKKIGTTSRGIGPAYEERAARRSILVRDLFSPQLEEKIETALKEKNALFKSLYGLPELQTSEILKKLKPAIEILKPYCIANSSLVISQQLKKNNKVLFEGAQGSMLDVLHGDFPFVTSSSTLSSSAAQSTGTPMQAFTKVVGVFKAYCTRVGSGPFPTELFNEAGEKLQTQGHEFGSTTGRKRRCGWIDLVALRYALRMNGFTSLAMMKLDVLTGFDKIGVCTEYKINGQSVLDYPSHFGSEKVEPVITYLPGWKEDITSIRTPKELPAAAVNYVDFISRSLASPIDVISVGPERDQTIWLKDLTKD